MADVVERPGVTTHSVYAWLRKFGKPGGAELGMTAIGTVSSSALIAASR